jgi:hypothetical protein
VFNDIYDCPTVDSPSSTLNPRSDLLPVSFHSRQNVRLEKTSSNGLDHRGICCPRLPKSQCGRCHAGKHRHNIRVLQHTGQQDPGEQANVCGTSMRFVTDLSTTRYVHAIALLGKLVSLKIQTDTYTNQRGHPDHFPQSHPASPSST